MFIARSRATGFIPRHLLFSSVKRHIRDDVVHLHWNLRRLTKATIATRKMKRKADEQLERDGVKTAQPSPRASMTYPDGAIRITRTPGRQYAKNCVNLSNIIDKDHLVSACIYAFFIADSELLHLLPVSRSSNTVPIYIGRDANPAMDSTLDAACQQAAVVVKGKLTIKQLEVVVPVAVQLYRQMHGKNLHAFYVRSAGSSHSKIMALVYPAFLRIVVTSCNMMDVDTVLGDNHWYIQDLPKLPSRDSVAPSSFETDFLGHMQALGVPEEFLESIRGMYDYSKVKVHLVTSVPGTHAGAKAEKHGLLRLRRVAIDLGIDLPRKKQDGTLQLEVCAASIGNLSAKWLNGFHDCALGRKDLEVTDKGAEKEGKEDYEVPDMKLFFPTVQDVRSADESAQRGAANIGCHIRQWRNAPVAIKRIFHHYQSKDAGRLFHQKMIVAYNPHENSTPPYYVYVGSANLSQSAWGSLEPDKRGNEETCDLKLTKMTNFECGVVVPGDLLKDLLEPGTSSWQEAIVPFEQTAKPFNIWKDKPWNDPGWVVGFEDDGASDRVR